MSSATLKPLSYYGGKQKLASRIVSLIPSHNLYCEPFIGGGAVFFKKHPSTVEVINDTNRELINFYEQVQNDFVSLEKHIRISLHSRDLHRKATVINTNPDMFSPLDRAWAVWILSSQSFASKLDGPWGYDRKGNETARKVHNKRESFTEELAIRLQQVQIECTDAIRIISSRDSADSFFFLDPPYIGACQGHYDGYMEEDYQMLLDKLASIEGKFLLSSYPTKLLDRYITQHGWYTKRLENLPITASKTRGKKKTEVLTANYPI